MFTSTAQSGGKALRVLVALCVGSLLASCDLGSDAASTARVAATATPSPRVITTEKPSANARTWTARESGLIMSLSVDPAEPRVGQPVRFRMHARSDDGRIHSVTMNWNTDGDGPGMTGLLGRCNGSKAPSEYYDAYTFTYAPKYAGTNQPLVMRVDASACAPVRELHGSVRGTVHVQG